MREYGKVTPQFWIGKTGKELRKSPEGLIVAMYLITCPHAHMLGIFYVPVLYIATETGLGMEGASKGLQSAIDAGFCSYDPVTEMVWVREMAKYQVATELKVTDNRCKGIQKDYEALPDNPFLSAFYDKYAQAFCMTKKRVSRAEKVSPSQAPSNPLPSQEQEQEQEQEKKHNNADADEFLAGLPKFQDKQDSRYVSFAELGFKTLPESWKELALERYPELNTASLRDLWLGFSDEYGKSAKSGATKPANDWLAQWGQWLSIGAQSKINNQQRARPASKTQSRTSTNPNLQCNEDWKNRQAPDYEKLAAGITHDDDDDQV